MLTGGQDKILSIQVPAPQFRSEVLTSVVATTN